jgi:hypothetical protein
MSEMSKPIIDFTKEATELEEKDNHNVDDWPLELAVVLKIDAQSRRRAFEIAEDKLTKNAEPRGELIQLVKYQAQELRKDQREWETLAARYGYDQKKAA